jgi:hypothetical protein
LALVQHQAAVYIYNHTSTVPLQTCVFDVITEKRAAAAVSIIY